MELPAKNNFYMNGLALINQHRALVVPLKTFIDYVRQNKSNIIIH